MTNKTQKAAIALLDQISTKKYSKIDELWGKLLDDPPTNARFYKELAQGLAKAHREAKLVELVTLAVMQWSEQGRHRDALRVIQIVMPYTINPKELHEPLLACLREVYGKRPNLERFLTGSGLLFDTEIKQSYFKLKTYLACDESQVFRHTSRGIGVVQSIDEHENSVVIDFGDGRPTRFSFDGVRQFLQAIPENHFLARRAHEPDRLKEWAQNDAQAFMKSLLRDFGGEVRQSELKGLLTENFFTEREWNSWWNRNRTPLRIDSYIEFRGASNVRIVLRKEPRSFLAECVDKFEPAKTWEERHAILRELEKVKSAEPLTEEIAGNLANVYGEAAGRSRSLGPSVRLEAAYFGAQLQKLLGDLVSLENAEDPKAALSDLADVQSAIQDVAIFEFQCQALVDLIDVSEDWIDTYVAMFAEAPLRLAQVLIKNLVEREKHLAVTEAVELIVARPSINPEIFVWVGRQILDGKLDPGGLDLPPIYLLICLLDFMEELGVNLSRNENAPASMKNANAKIRELLMADGHENICRVIRDVDTAEARHFLASVQGHKSLSDTYKLSIETALRNIRSDFEDGTGRHATAGPHFVTADSLQRSEEEYQRLKSVEIPANSRAIGEAAEKGDLKENADYHAAKAHQKILFARIEELHDLLSRARAFEPEAVHTESVNPGTRIQARNLDTGELETYTLLGIWDAVLEENILYYNSPFGAQFMGKQTNETFPVTLPSGEELQYKLESIENALIDTAATP